MSDVSASSGVDGDRGYVRRQFERLDKSAQFALKVRGDQDETHWISISPATMRKVADVLAGDGVRVERRLSDYADWECEDRRNHYGQPVIRVDCFDGIHYAGPVPVAGGDPPACSCGFTRERQYDGSFYELVDHIADMGEFGSLTGPV